MPCLYGDFLAALSAPWQVFTEDRLQNLRTSVALLGEKFLNLDSRTVVGDELIKVVSQEEEQAD